MAQDYLLIFLMVSFSYLLGSLIFSLIAPNQFKKFNLFIKLAINWGLGNLVLIVTLHYLAFLNKLELITTNNFLIVFGMVVFLFLMKVFYNLKQTSKIFTPDLLWLVVLFIFLIPLLMHSLFSPFNAWGGLAIWGLKAKVLLQDPPIINNYFFTDSYYQFAHQDYPLGLPLLMNFYYRLVGTINDQAVQFYLLFFYINILFTYLGALLHWFKNRLTTVAIFLIFLIISTIPNYIIYSHNGYADVSLASMFTITSFLFISFFDNLKLESWLLILLMAITSCFIKAEGYLFFVSVVTIFTLFLLLQKKKLITNGYSKFLAIVLLIISSASILIWEYYKLTLNIKGEFGQIILGNVFSEMKIIFHTYLNELINTNRYSLTLIPAILIYLYQISHFAFNRQWFKLIPNLLIVFQLGAYTLIYLITPNPLLWQLTSFERIFLHILPIIFLIIIYNSHILWLNKK